MKKLVLFLYICIAVTTILYFNSRNKTNYTVVEKIELVEIDMVSDIAVTESVVTNWDNFIEAIIWKESRGNENCAGDNGKAIGVLQIHPIMVREANRILKMKGKEEVYTYEDRLNRAKSIEIFNIVQNFHNKSHDFERALQIWNKNHPESYKTDIMNKYNELMSI